MLLPIQVPSRSSNDDTAKGHAENDAATGHVPAGLLSHCGPRPGWGREDAWRGPRAGSQQRLVEGAVLI